MIICAWKRVCCLAWGQGSWNSCVLIILWTMRPLNGIFDIEAQAQERHDAGQHAAWSCG